ncbi:centromere protein U [Pocillopora verrucosa]|uniref:centromere protein U n=1 Tax=Pocillopora verrucosa TaxID=203993 RepID=UPI003341F04A
MAAELEDARDHLSQNTRASVRFTRQAGLERRRPSKRQTTLRSFKINTNWRDRSTQVATTTTAISSQGLPDALPSGQELSPVPPIPDQGPPKNSRDSLRSPLIESLVASKSNVTHHLEVLQDSSPIIPRQSSVLADHEQVLLVSHSRTPDGSPSSIILYSSEDETKTDQGSMVRTPNQSPQKFLSDKTPVSGPVAFKTRNSRKRKGKVAEPTGDEEMESLENEYRKNNFVRLFNADHGRKKRMSEITDLDVILTAVEEEALEIRNNIETTSGKQAIKELFIQMRKTFSETIDIHRENQMLKANLRKAKSKVNKLRKDLLSVQQKRSRILLKIEQEEKKVQQNQERQKALEDFSSFLVDLEALQNECRKEMSSKKASTQDYGSCDNLPSLLIEGHSSLTAATQLRSINELLKQRQ